MRTAIFAVLILVIAPISGLVTAENENQQNALEDEQNLILPTYSVAVQLAFERVSDLEQYSKEELDNAEEWLIVSTNNIDEQLADNSLINLNNALSNKSYKLLVKKNIYINSCQRQFRYFLPTVCLLNFLSEYTECRVVSYM